MSRLNRLALLMIVLTAALVGCAGAERNNGVDDSTGGISDAHLPHADTVLTADMHRRLIVMSQVRTDSLERLLPSHRAAVTILLDTLDARLRVLNGGGDTIWSSLSDSVRRDLSRMFELTPSELPTFLPDHRLRLERILSIHDSVIRARQ